MLKKRILISIFVIILLLVAGCQLGTNDKTTPGPTQAVDEEGVIGIWSTKMNAVKELYEYELDEEPFGMDIPEFRIFYAALMNEFFDDVDYVLNFKEDGDLDIRLNLPLDKKEKFLQEGTQAVYLDLEKDLESYDENLEDFKVDYLEEYGEELEVTTVNMLSGIWDEIIESINESCRDLVGTYIYTYGDSLITVGDGEDIFLKLEGDTISFAEDQEAELPDFFYPLKFERE